MVKTLLPMNQTQERALLRHLDKHPARTEQCRPTLLPTQFKPPNHNWKGTLSRRGSLSPPVGEEPRTLLQNAGGTRHSPDKRRTAARAAPPAHPDTLQIIQNPLP